MNNPFHFLSAMLLRGAISAFCALLCSSCATEKWGLYEVLHRERFQDDYEAILLKSDDSVRFNVEYKGQPICETEVDPEEIRAVVGRYRSGHPSDDVTVFYRDGKTTSVNFLPQGEDTVVLFDLDGDGYPERRATLGPDPSGMLEEELVPQVVSSRRPFPKNEASPTIAPSVETESETAAPPEPPEQP